MILLKILKKILLSIYHRFENAKQLLQIKVWYFGQCYFSALVRQQRKDPLSIPIIIINFNQLFYLKQLIEFLLARNFKQIVILDNQSDYEPLLDYYKQIEQQGVVVERMDKNYGHRVFYLNNWLQQKYGRGYYVLTDADIVPNPECPAEFMHTFIQLLDKHIAKVVKVGFALRIDDIPDAYPLKEKVLNWERQFWDNEIEKDTYLASLDTTFALYFPTQPKRISNHFFKAIRVAGHYCAKHGGWYINLSEKNEEYEHYRKSATLSNSWKMDENGDLKGDYSNKY